MTLDRLPPHDMGAEEATLGSAMIDEGAIDVIADILRPSDFYGEKNRLCFEGMLALSARGEAINQVTLAHELSDHDRLDGIGGVDYLAHLVMITPSSTSVAHYARIVRREALSRDLIAAGLDIVEIGYSGGADGAAALANAERSLLGARRDWGGAGFAHIRDALDAFLAISTGGDEDGIKAARVPTGFAGVDNLLGGGLGKSDMAVIAARPSFGKSAFAFTLARKAAGLGYATGIFSLEMSIDQIALRLLSAECEIDSYRLRSGLMSDAETTRLMDAVGDISDLPIWVDDSPIQTVAEMRARARRLQAESGLDLIIVDYIQLIGGGSGRRENRAVELGEVSRGLKAMARELNAPALVCSQLSRAIEQRPSKRPLLSDLRESGSIEQDADVVGFLHREDMYVTKEDWERMNPSDPYPENMAEIIVAKHRNGPIGSAVLYFRKDLARFEELGV